MKFKYWALSLLACGGMLSCTNEDVVDSSNGKGETSTSYLAVNILTTSAPGTRVDGYEDGSDTENQIDQMHFYLFNEDGSPYTLIGGTNRVVPGDSYQVGENDKENETVEEVGQSVLVINGSTATPPAKILAVLNSSSDLSGRSLSQLKEVSDNYLVTGAGKFIMSNSVYNDGSTIGEVSLEGKLTNNAEEAKENPVDIYVERVLAKVEVSFGGENKKTSTDGKPMYLVSGTDGDANAIYAKVLGWQVADFRDKSFILKNISTTWDNTTIGIDPWSSNDFHRSFWATSTGNVKNSYTWNAISGNNTAVYTQENTPASTNDFRDLNNNDLTKVIVAVQLVDKDGNAKARYQYMGVEYGSEDDILTLIAPNFDEYYIKTATDTYRQIAATELVFKPGNKVGGDAYRVYPQLAESFEAAMDGEKKNLYTKSSDGSFVVVSDITPVNTDLKKYYAQIWEEGRAYYYTTIKHIATASSAVGQYGIVRNHVYKVQVTDIEGFGTPVYDPDEDYVIDPELPEDDASYLAAKINVLAWKIVNSDVTLGK